MITNFSFLIKFLFFIQISCFVSCIELFSTDPDLDRNTTQLIASRGFSSETHYVVTDDGYILTIFRIINPFLRNRQNLYPIYLQYGILGNTEQWLISGQGSLTSNGTYIETNGVINNCYSNDSVAQTLPFVLSVCGYDVWLGNIRGSKYSTHILLSRKDSRFWDFTLDQISAYDIPAIIRYILRETYFETIGCIGYSLGNSHLFQLLSAQPQFSQVIKPFISLASFVYLGNIRSPIVRLAQVFEPILRVMPSTRIGGLGELQPLFGRFFCGNSFLKNICLLVFELIGGFDIWNVNKFFLPRLFAAFPDGFSSVGFSHIGQRIRTKRFDYYDYGEDRNLKVYGQRNVPDYNLSRIDSKYLVLMSGLNDFLSDDTDDDILRSQLTVRPYLDYVVPYPLWTHGDFLYANTVGTYINSAILRVFESLHLNSKSIL